MKLSYANQQKKAKLEARIEAINARVAALSAKIPKDAKSDKKDLNKIKVKELERKLVNGYRQIEESNLPQNQDNPISMLIIEIEAQEKLVSKLEKKYAPSTTSTTEDYDSDNDSDSDSGSDYDSDNDSDSDSDEDSEVDTMELLYNRIEAVNARAKALREELPIDAIKDRAKLDKNARGKLRDEYNAQVHSLETQKKDSHIQYGDDGTDELRSKIKAQEKLVSELEKKYAPSAASTTKVSGSSSRGKTNVNNLMDTMTNKTTGDNTSNTKRNNKL